MKTIRDVLVVLGLLTALMSGLIVLSYVAITSGMRFIASVEQSSRDMTAREFVSSETVPEKAASKTRFEYSDEDFFRPVDRSLPIEDYEHLGFPALGDDWNCFDIKFAAELIAELATAGPEFLPRYKSPRSGALFSHITDRRIPAYLSDRDIPTSTRLDHFLAYTQSLTALENAYVLGQKSGMVGDEELLEIKLMQPQIFSDYCISLYLEHEDYLRNLPWFHPSHHLVHKFTTQREKLCVAALNRALEVIQCRRCYRPSGSARAVDIIRATLPTLMPHMSDEGRSHISETILESNTKDENADLQPNLQKLSHLAQKLEIELRENKPSSISIENDEIVQGSHD